MQRKQHIHILELTLICMSQSLFAVKCRRENDVVSYHNAFEFHENLVTIQKRVLHHYFLKSSRESQFPSQVLEIEIRLD